MSILVLPLRTIGRQRMFKTRRLWISVTTVLAVTSLAATCSAGGLIQHLPADGPYVVFRAKSEFDLMGNLQSFERELKVASVGKQEVDGEPGRWIELSTEFAGRKVLAKLLIAEKFLKADQDPFSHIAKAWGRGREGELVELQDAQLRRIMVFALG